MATQNSTLSFPSAQPFTRLNRTIADLTDLVEQHVPAPSSPHSRSRQMSAINGEISNQDESSRIAAVFSLAASIAGAAIEAVSDVQAEPETEKAELAETLKFWFTVRDCMLVAALDCRGGNNSLTEALVARRLIEKCEGRI